MNIFDDFKKTREKLKENQYTPLWLTSDVYDILSHAGINLSGIIRVELRRVEK